MNYLKIMKPTERLHYQQLSEEELNKKEGGK